jgi:prolyl oligopeptidase
MASLEEYMSKKIPILFAVLVLLVLVGTTAAFNDGHESTPAVGTPPKTQVNEVKEVIQGVEISDPYRWLEDQNSSETRSWIDTQNAYTDSQLAKLPGREELKQRLSAFIKIDFMGVPVVENDRYFFFKRQGDQDQAILYMRKGLKGKDEVLIDPLPMSADHSTSIFIDSISQDGRLLAYSVRQGGQDEVVPHLFDVDAHKDLPDSFPKARYGAFAVTPDKSGVYVSRLSPEGPRVFFHKVGADSAKDAELFGKGYGPDKIISIDVSEDGHYLFIEVAYGATGDRTEIYFQDLRTHGPITTVVNDLDAAFFPQVAGDKMYLRTNWKAPKWRLLEVDLKHPSRDQWREVLPESQSVLEGFSPVGGKLAARMTENVISRVKLFDTAGKLIREIAPPTIGSLSGLAGRWQSNEAFFTFRSYHVPTTVYRYDLATGKQSVWSQLKVPIETDKYEVEQVWYSSKDGTKVPMFLAHAKGLKRDGSNPVLMTGYGGFNISSTPGFNPMAAAWIASGGIYAVANLRGGGEFGEEWHRAGMLGNKQNVFDDFIAAAEWLIQNNYTKASRLAIHGRSNGGLLMGAMITQRPDLFGAIICGYPLLDMVRYQKFKVAKYWVPEYGSSDDPEQFKYIYAYSPYHHVRPGAKYPAILLESGDSDTRVDPLHARKMTAMLQAANSSEHPVLLHYDTKAGHSGGEPISKQIENLTNELGFLFWQLGMRP